MNTSSKKREKNVYIALSLIGVGVIFYLLKSFLLVHDKKGLNSILGFTDFTFSFQSFIIVYFAIILGITAIISTSKTLRNKKGIAYKKFFFLTVILCVIIWLYESVKVGNDMMFHFSEH